MAYVYASDTESEEDLTEIPNVERLPGSDDSSYSDEDDVEKPFVRPDFSVALPACDESAIREISPADVKNLARSYVGAAGCPAEAPSHDEQIKACHAKVARFLQRSEARHAFDA